MMAQTSEKFPLYKEQNAANTQGIHMFSSIATPGTATPATATSTPIPPSSMLADLTLPRPVSAKTALRMVRTCIKSIMYLRGQMGSPWEQLEQMLQLEQLHQEQEQEGHLENPFIATSATIRSEVDNDSANYITIPRKSLQEFLLTGERMFVDLEESVYSQLYQHLKSESSKPLEPSGPRLYISLALLFGSTITTPKEQYMIRIGPLEPQQAVLTEPSSRGFTFSDNQDISNASSPSMSPPTCFSAITPPTSWHDTEMELKRSREEKAWERRLIQQIMGITSIMDTDTQLDQQRHQYEQSSVSSFQLSPSALSNRTKVHLLMKAPSGLVFQGILPKQMVTVQEDYSLNDIEAAKANSNSSSAAPISGGKKRRWPIHHIHVFGPAPSHTPSSLSSTPVPALDTQNEIWYQVGPGIPVLSPLL